MNFLYFGAGLGIIAVGLGYMLLGYDQWIGLSIVIAGLFVIGYAKEGTWI